MISNRHDTWKRFCNMWRDVLAETGLPITVTHNEYRFRDLLSQGSVVVDTRITLEERSSAEWFAIYKFAAVFFREFESFNPENLFQAFRDEAERRGNKFPR